MIFLGKSLAFFAMTGTIGCLGLILLVGFIILLFFRRNKIQKGVNEFYEKKSLSYTENSPAVVREALGDANWQCYIGELETPSGKIIPFHWWRGFITRLTSSGGTTQTSFDYYLAVSFSPNVVDKEFQQKAKQFADTKNLSFGEKLKRFFVLDTKTPIRVEELADGSFLIVWRSLDRADIYEDKMNWLRNNLATPTIKTSENLPALIVETNDNIERIPYAEIRSSAPLEVRGTIEVLMRVLDSMNRDYHDTKAHPTMTIEDHAKYLNLNQNQTDFVKNSLFETSYSPKVLNEKGFNFPEINSYTSQAVDVIFPHRKMTYFTAQDIYIDFAEPSKIYVYQK